MSNVNVYCRFRPPKKPNDPLCVAFSEPATIKLGPLTFSFDAVFGPETTQTVMYQKTTQIYLPDILKGYNFTLLSYGQTSSGKTYTTFGRKNDFGIVQRLCESLWTELPTGTRVSLSCVEIYMEAIYDLLEEKGEKPKLIRELPNGNIFIEGLTEVYVGSQKDVLRNIETAEMSRTIAATLMNERSSRSHCLFQLHMEQPNGIHSRIAVVDLAGSEKVKKSGASGVVLQQAGFINKSLFNLSNVIHLLSDPKTRHSYIPYRDSKLTRILQDSLGGNSKTAVIIAALPTEDSREETLSTLRFGLRCKAVINKPRVNTLELTIDVYKQRLAAAEAEIAELRKQPATSPLQGPCLRCPALEQELQELRAREEASKQSLGTLEDAAKDMEKYLVQPLPADRQLSALELRQKIEDYETAQKYMVLRQHYLLKLLSSRNVLMQALEQQVYKHK